jgi:uncharacterized protein (DUF488 family)
MQFTRLYTIGYEGTNLLSFITSLLTQEVRVLADVRAVPLSRKRGFSKRSLGAALEAVGIDYVHLRELGNPPPGRLAAKEGNYDRFERIYRHHLRSDTAQEKLRYLVELARANRTCLVCFEREPIECHRSIIASSLGDRFQIVNLFAEPDDRASGFAPRRRPSESRPAAQQEIW